MNRQGPEVYAGGCEERFGSNAETEPRGTKANVPAMTPWEVQGIAIKRRGEVVEAGNDR